MKFRMIVISKEIIEDSLVLQLNTINSKGKPITKGRNAAFMELWLPNLKSLNKAIEENITVFNVDFDVDYRMTYKNSKMRKKRHSDIVMNKAHSDSEKVGE